jgi:PAS domain S-box-containing protein
MAPQLTTAEIGHIAAIVAYSDDAIISKNLQGIVISWNRGAERLYGYTAAEMIGQPIALLIPSDMPNEEPEILRRLQQGEVIDHYETVRMAKDGRRLDVSVTISPIKDESGTIVAASKIARDITDRKRIEGELRRLNLELERRVTERTAELRTSNDELESFSYSVSHDLRTPIRSIQGFSELLQEEFHAALGKEGNAYLDRIIAAAHRMDDLTRDILAFARTGQVTLGTEPVDMRRLVDEAIAELEAQTEGRRVEWTIGPLPQVKGDAALLKQVWVNLLSNALKYTRNREIARVGVTGREEGGIFVFEVTDNGVGFEMIYAERLFHIFERLHPEQFEGTGVGLAHVRRIVERHGGRVEAEGRLGEGAVFRFVLPRSSFPEKPE